MTEKRVKVLYIAGDSRSGSTLLDCVLGQVGGVFSTGEFHDVSVYGLTWNLPCGCGVPFHQCPTWQRIFERAFGGMDLVPARQLVELRRYGNRLYHLPLLLVPALGRRLLGRRMGQYVDSLARTYQAVREVTGCRVIVDASKVAWHGCLLEAAGVDLYVVHLLRDARAVAHSKQRVVHHPGNNLDVTRLSPLASALLWNLRETLPEVLWGRRAGRYLRIRYEDFIVNPREWLGRIMAMLGEPDAELPMAGERQVELKPLHGIFGNPSRFRTGLVQLRPDEEWRDRMKLSHRLLVTGLTFPLLARYGYRAMLPNGD